MKLLDVIFQTIKAFILIEHYLLDNFTRTIVQLCNIWIFEKMLSHAEELSPLAGKKYDARITRV